MRNAHRFTSNVRCQTEMNVPGPPRAGRSPRGNGKQYGVARWENRRLSPSSCGRGSSGEGRDFYPTAGPQEIGEDQAMDEKSALVEPAKKWYQ